jgi:hypothetical protein
VEGVLPRIVQLKRVRVLELALVNICVVRSVFTEIPNHEPALIMMNTGANIIGRPSMGAWLTTRAAKLTR